MTVAANRLPRVRSELRETVSSLLEEKKNFVCQIHDQQQRIEELSAQVSINTASTQTHLKPRVTFMSSSYKRHDSRSLIKASATGLRLRVSAVCDLSCLQSHKDQAEMKQLCETVEQQSKTIKRFNRGESPRS